MIWWLGFYAVLCAAGYAFLYAVLSRVFRKPRPRPHLLGNVEGKLVCTRCGFDPDGGGPVPPCIW